MSVGDYLDDILHAGDTPKGPQDQNTGVRTVGAPRTTARKERFTVQIAPSIPEEYRNAAVFLLMAGEQASVAGLVEAALVEFIERMRDKHCDGRPFPVRPYGPPPGRRLLREPPAG